MFLLGSTWEGNQRPCSFVYNHASILSVAKGIILSLIYFKYSIYENDCVLLTY